MFDFLVSIYNVIFGSAHAHTHTYTLYALMQQVAYIMHTRHVIDGAVYDSHATP